MESSGGPHPRAIQALRVRQWLPGWDSIDFDSEVHRRRPNEHFYLFSISASDLKALTGIRRRDLIQRAEGRTDTGIQRAHDSKRSDEIAKFIDNGFPHSALSNAQRRSGRYDDLKKPGWLPTSIIVNVHSMDANGSGPMDVNVHEDDLVQVSDTGEGTARLQLPRSFTGINWEPKDDHPIDVIDGQHRLWAFDLSLEASEYQLPVVAFVGLDWSWQAYLFYTINIKPERINPSLAFDLYPLLRTEDWLQRIEGPAVYRETRSQELTQTLWAHPASPWYRHINMLGRRGGRQMVRQAAWIRSLMATYVRSGARSQIGGLFGSQLGGEVLPWSRAQQSAFLILMGQKMQEAILESNHGWAEVLREAARYDGSQLDPAFYGAQSLLNTDQGIRGLLHITNDLCYLSADDLNLKNWFQDTSPVSNDIDAVDQELSRLENHDAVGFLEELSYLLASFDWRTLAAPDLSEEQEILKAAYRGSGGYRMLRRQLLLHLIAGPTSELRDTAADIYEQLGYEQ